MAVNAFTLFFCKTTIHENQVELSGDAKRWLLIPFPVKLVQPQRNGKLSPVLNISSFVSSTLFMCAVTGVLHWNGLLFSWILKQRKPLLFTTSLTLRCLFFKFMIVVLIWWEDLFRVCKRKSDDHAYESLSSVFTVLNLDSTSSRESWWFPEHIVTQCQHSSKRRPAKVWTVYHQSWTERIILNSKPGLMVCHTRHYARALVGLEPVPGPFILQLDWLQTVLCAFSRSFSGAPFRQANLH